MKNRNAGKGMWKNGMKEKGCVPKNGTREGKMQKRVMHTTDMQENEK